MRKLLAVALVILVAVSIPVSLSEDTDAADGVQGTPSAYNMSDHYRMPSMRDQGEWNVCYAFATVGALESSLLVDGYDTRLSELYLAASSYFSDERGTYWNPSATPYFNGGGMPICCFQILSDGYGTATASEVPFSDISMDYVLPSGIDTVMVVTGFSYITNPVLHQDEVKRYVMQGHQLVTGFPAGEFGIDYTDAQGRTFRTFRCEGESNHAVTIVGWDDDVSASYFGLTDPEKKGGWLIKNSWGDEDLGGGYYYVSYYADVPYAIAVDSYYLCDGTVNIYSYDHVPGGETIGTDRAANIFTAGGYETLGSVSFETFSSDYDYTVRVYTDCDAGAPESGRLSATVSGHHMTQGELSVDLGTAVSLRPGERFSVVVSIEDDRPAFAVEDLPTETSAFTIITHSSAGESFAVEDGQWRDVSSSGHTNLRIKAYTTDSGVSDPVISVIAVAVVAAAFAGLVAVGLCVIRRRGY